MKYNLCENVYLVNGRKNSCIYDLNNLKLYHLNQELRDWLKKTLTSEKNSDFLNGEKKDMLIQLINLKLICESNSNEKKEVKNQEHKINFAWIEITTACNLRCIHCYEESGSSKVTEITMQDFDRVLEQLIQCGVNKIQFIGGEPLIDGEKLIKMIAKSYGKFDSIEVFTNGTLLTDHIINEFKKYQVKVALSVYSYIEGEHDKVTKVPGSWKKTNGAINRLKENNIPYRVCNVLMKNVKVGEQNTNLYRLSKRKDVVRMSGRANVNLLDPELIKKKLITEEYFTRKLDKNLFERMKNGHNCFATKIYVAADLTIYPCVMERRIKHGNIREHSLKEILDENIMGLKKDEIEGCGECEFRYACFDCRPNSFSLNVREKPWYCTYDPINGIWLDVDEFIHAILCEKI